MANIKVQTLPNDALVDIQISGVFYRQLTDLLLGLGDSRLPEEFQKVLEKMKDNNPPEDLYELNVQTITTLVYEIELKGIEQGKTKWMEVDEATGQFIEDSSSESPPAE